MQPTRPGRSDTVWPLRGDVPAGIRPTGGATSGPAGIAASQNCRVDPRNCEKDYVRAALSHDMRGRLVTQPRLREAQSGEAASSPPRLPLSPLPPAFGPRGENGSPAPSVSPAPLQSAPRLDPLQSLLLDRYAVLLRPEDTGTEPVVRKEITGQEDAGREAGSLWAERPAGWGKSLGKNSEPMGEGRSRTPSGRAQTRAPRIRRTLCSSRPYRPTIRLTYKLGAARDSRQ